MEIDGKDYLTWLHEIKKKDARGTKEEWAFRC